MIADVSPDVHALFRRACSAPLFPPEQRTGGFSLDGAGCAALLPHRGASLLIDRVTDVDPSLATIACAYDLVRAQPLVEGHFPGSPVWPGVLQVEAVGQAGLCLIMLRNGAAAGGALNDFFMTHILGARFVRPVEPAGELEIVAHVVADGVFSIVIGQCLQHGEICSSAALRGIEKEKAT